MFDISWIFEKIWVTFFHFLFLEYVRVSGDFTVETTAVMIKMMKKKHRKKGQQVLLAKKYLIRHMKLDTQ